MLKQRENATCQVCGKECRVRKVNGYVACPTCENIVRGVKNRPDLVRRLLGEIHGGQPGDDSTLDGIRSALGVPGNTPDGDLPEVITDLMRERGEYAAELDMVRKALECDADDSLLDVAEHRMAVLRKLDESYAEAYERAEALEREVEIGNEARTNLQRELDQVRARLNQTMSVTLESKASPAGSLPVSRLLSDRDLLAAVNMLAGAFLEG